MRATIRPASYLTTSVLQPSEGNDGESEFDDEAGESEQEEDELQSDDEPAEVSSDLCSRFYLCR